MIGSVFYSDGYIKIVIVRLEKKKKVFVVRFNYKLGINFEPHISHLSLKARYEYGPLNLRRSGLELLFPADPPSAPTQ